MTEVRRLQLLVGAAQATGPTAVLDVFRAFTTAAFALDAGAEGLVLVGEVGRALGLRHELDGALLVGEEDGARPPGFDLGNSPAEIADAGRLDGRIVVLRTSAGVRAVLAALRAGASPVFAASLVVAGATARLLAAHCHLSLVTAGWNGVEIADEDEACADLIEAHLTGTTPNPEAARAKAVAGAGARRLASGGWAHPGDLEMCLEVDRFRFAMEAGAHPSGAELRAVRS